MSEQEKQSRAAVDPEAPECPKCGRQLQAYTLHSGEKTESTMACPVCGPPEPAVPVPHVIPRRTDDELRVIVRDLAAGHIFCSADMRLSHDPHALAMVFMPLGLGAFHDWTQEEVTQIGIIYEYLSQAGPMAVNNMPTFFSMKVLHAEDWNIVRESLKREIERAVELVRPEG